VVKESGMVNPLFVKEAFCSKLAAGAIFFRSAVKAPPRHAEARPPKQSPLGSKTEIRSSSPVRHMKNSSLFCQDRME
jgi:hypothetical protein